MGLRITGVQEAIDTHREAARRARDLRPLFAQFALELDAMIDRAWGERRNPGGAAWAPLRGPSEATGALRGAHQIVIGERTFSIVVPSDHARAQFFGRRGAPGRNPLPVDRTGAWIMTGAAGEWWRRHLERVRAWLSLDDRTVRR